jgi:enediyne biosynthesis protein E4
MNHPRHSNGHVILPGGSAPHPGSVACGDPCAPRCSLALTWGSAPHLGSVACGDPCAPRRSLAGAPCAPKPCLHRERDRFAHILAVQARLVPTIAILFAAGALAVAGAQNSPLGFTFTNIAAAAGLTSRTVYGGEHTNKYLLETTGCGAAALDYDGDGWLDIFLVNGTTLEGFPKGQEPTNRLYRNKGDGSFEDVTSRAGLAQSGWGQGACAGDYDNDGREDLFVTYWGQNRLYRNKGDGTFEDATNRAGLTSARTRWGAGCALFDYNRDGLLDIIAANYIDLDLASTPVPESGLCRYKGIPVACGPPGLPGGKNVLYRNLGNGTFEDVSDKSGISRARGTYGLGVATVDFNDDGWVDVYVANDSNPSALYVNNRDGTFTDVGITAGCAYSQDGKPQAGMGIAVGDYDRNGTLDIFKTNFAGDTSTLYANTGNGLCEDRTFAAGIGLNTRWLGWGVGFLDLDSDGWLDLFLVNGHVYPEVERIKTEAGYKQRKVVYRNLRNGRFADVTEQLGDPVTVPKAGRGAAFADFDNDGDIDIVVNNVHDAPDLYRLDQTGERHWIALKLVGTQSNRSAIGARVRLVTAEGAQLQEVRGGGSYYSQNDLRVHFGLGGARAIERIEVRWPNGREETWTELPIDRLHTLKEGAGK